MTEAPQILVVEDDPDVRMSIVEALEDASFRVASAGNGRQALEYLGAATTLPQLILLDLMMPVMDGFQFREAQGRVPTWAAIPTVVLTASSNAIDGKTPTMAKPISLDDLVATASRYCSVVA